MWTKWCTQPHLKVASSSCVKNEKQEVRRDKFDSWKRSNFHTPGQLLRVVSVLVGKMRADVRCRLLLIGKLVSVVQSSNSFPHTFPTSKLARLHKTIYFDFPRLTIPDPCPRHAATGPVCAGETGARGWTSLFSPVSSFFTQRLQSAWTTLNNFQERLWETVCLLLSPHVNHYWLNSFSLHFERQNNFKHLSL